MQRAVAHEAKVAADGKPAQRNHRLYQAGCEHECAADQDRYAALGAALRARPPHGTVTIARGSSDHAAAYMAYLIMARSGQLVTSLPMSLLTLYQAPLAIAESFQRAPG